MPADLQESPVPLAEISQGPNAFEQFLDRNQKNIIILAILIAIGVAGFVIYRGIETSRQETAGAALNKAEDLAALQAVITEHADTTAAHSAMVLLADRQWTEGQQDAAVETLRKFISSNPEHPAIASAQASLGAKLMTQGKSADAAKVFQDIADDPKARYIAPYALISLGDIAKVAGDLEKAEASYNRVKTDFSDSSFAETATRRIATLKAKAPAEIAPPPKPATPPADPAAAIKSSLPPGITVTPVEEAPAKDGASAPAPAPPAAEAPVVTPPQEAPAAPSNENKPAEPPAAPEKP
jgi:predicted negative regulator of RcsB-dependent stress response